MRVLIRGGSIPAGRGVTRSYVDILKECFAPSGVEIINRSRERETSFDGIETFQQDIHPFHPDILVLHFGIDDAFGGVYRSEFKENLVQIVRLARAGFDPLIMLATSHVFENPNDMNAVNLYYQAIRQVAGDLACEFIPVHIYWAGYLQSRNLLSSEFVQEDARYPNERGHEIFAEAFHYKLKKGLDLFMALTGPLQF